MSLDTRKFSARKSGRSLAIVVGTALCGAAVLMAAQANERSAEFNRRAYVGIGAGVTQLEPKPPHESITVSENTDTGFHGVIGYDFTSRLSAEVYYADLGAAQIAFLGTDVGEIDYQVFGLSGLVYFFNSRSGIRANSATSGLAAREGLSLFGRVGIGGVSADSELDHEVKHSTHLALGLGAEYGFKNGFAVRGEYQAFDSDQHYASVSLIKRFGKVASAAPIVPLVTKAVQPSEPVAAPEAPKKPTLSGVPTVYFAFDRSVISPVAAKKLDEVVAAIGDSDENITLEGHTDWIATERYNQDLSLRRAESVRRYLESKGINRSRISVRGFGEMRPIASNSTAEGRASNRRVDIRIN